LTPEGVFILPPYIIRNTRAPTTKKSGRTDIFQPDHNNTEPFPLFGTQENFVKQQLPCRVNKQFEAREYRILASQSVVGLFLDEESQSLAQLSDFIGKPISLQVETSYTQEQCDIILL
jgi:hypothetical protein